MAVYPAILNYSLEFFFQIETLQYILPKKLRLTVGKGLILSADSN